MTDDDADLSHDPGKGCDVVVVGAKCWTPPPVAENECDDVVDDC